MCFEDIYDVFYNQDRNVIIYISRYRVYIANLNLPNYNYTKSSIFIPNIIDYSYVLNENILYVINNKTLDKINITTQQQYRDICNTVNVQYIIYVPDDEIYCMNDNGISILNTKTTNQFDVWKPLKNKKIKYGCKPLLTPDGLLVPINNGNKLICIETKTHIISEVYKRTFDCVVRFSDISDDNIFIIVYKKSIEIRNTRNINQVLYRFEEADIPIPFPLTEGFKYNLSIIGNYSFIRIYDIRKILYSGLTINLTNYNITKHISNIHASDNEKICYILPYNTQDDTPNMIVLSHVYDVRESNIGNHLIRKYDRTYFRIVSMKND